MTTIYEDVLAAGVPIDSHESDLYFMATPKAREIMRKHDMVNRTPGNQKRVGKGMGFEFFVSNVDGKVWVDVPSGFDPWWQNRNESAGAMWERAKDPAETRVVDRLLRDIRDPSP